MIYSKIRRTAFKNSIHACMSATVAFILRHKTTATRTTDGLAFICVID